MASTTRITELSVIISTNVMKVNSYNAENGLPSQSFDPNVPPFYPYPPDIEQARQQVLFATDELHDLLAGPVKVFTRPYVRIFYLLNPLYYASNYPNSEWIKHG